MTKEEFQKEIDRLRKEVEASKKAQNNPDARNLAEIQDQQEQSDKAQHKEYERRLLDKGFIESLNPIAQENLRMEKEFREERKENEQFVALLLNEISNLTKQVEASKKLCQIYYEIALFFSSQLPSE
jgi:hypothetical protein